MPWPYINPATSRKTKSTRDDILRGLFTPEFAGPNVVHPGAVTPQGWYEEKVAAAMGYPTLVRHPTGPIGSYMRKVGSTNETPTDQFGQSWSSTAPQWMNVGGEWYNVSRPQSYMGDATMIGGGPIGSYTSQKTQPTPLSAIAEPSQPLSQTQWAGLRPADSVATMSQDLSYQKALEGTKRKQATGQQSPAIVERAKAEAVAKKAAEELAKKKEAEKAKAAAEAGVLAALKYKAGSANAGSAKAGSAKAARA